MSITPGEHAAGLKLDISNKAGLQVADLDRACMLNVRRPNDIQG